MKRIVICADGTWNLRDQMDKETGKRRPTNVTKIARAIRPRAQDGTYQVVFYHDGLGTRGGTDKLTGGAFGTGIEHNIQNLYRSIIYNYEPGDELFFFGFSRGAFTVRSLAGFMTKFGLIEKDDDYYLLDIYACYENGHGPDSKEWKQAFRKVVGTRPCPPIKFIGVWDTVGALGAPGVMGKVAGLFGGNKYEYHEVGLHPCIENAYHALAVDERRRPFEPTLWRRPPDWKGKLEQAWFAGVHSNVGGSYTPDGLANEALHWIVEKAEALGLKIDDVYLEKFRPCFNSTLHDSMNWKYRLMVPYSRPIGQQLADGELVHQSVIDRQNFPDCKYVPANLLAVQKKGTVPPLTNTTRIARGTPCPPMKAGFS